MSIAPLFLFASIFILQVLAPSLPNVIKYHLIGASFVVGLMLGGPEGMKNATHTREDLLGANCALVSLGIMVFGFFHALYLVDAGILTTDFSSLMIYFLSMIFPASIVASFLTYELLDSRETTRTLTFRGKRFFGRTMLGVGYGLAVLFAVHITTSLLGVTKSAGWLGFIVVSMGTLILVLGCARFRQLLEDLASGEW